MYLPPQISFKISLIKKYLNLVISVSYLVCFVVCLIVCFVYLFILGMLIFARYR